jgi:hypothetical protein
MRYIECPTEYSSAGPDVSVFLAGGITGTFDWQTEMAKLLGGTNLTIINPRRKNWGNANVAADPAVLAVTNELLEKKQLRAKMSEDHPDTKNMDIRIAVLEKRAAELTLEVAQIEWEHRHLLRSDAILFWFPPETLCPIALYELGAWNFRPKKLFIGCHPDYQRKRDVEIQTRLERPAQVVVDSLEALAKQVMEWEKAKAEDYFHRDQDQPDSARCAPGVKT